MAPIRLVHMESSPFSRAVRSSLISLIFVAVGLEDYIKD